MTKSKLATAIKYLLDETNEPDLNIAFASVVGSHNYGTANENSDIDVKVVYWPTFEQFYKNSFKTSDIHSEDIDITTHPIQKYMRYVFKGNMNFFEPFFSDHFESDVFDECMIMDIQTLVCADAKAVVKAQYYTALNKEAEAKTLHDELASGK
ncbi:nucleotidyltransferase domain-containing protein, partial [Candidatus Babeliales bacterium]|nr:nucleotidyltransferase domain-containing protein [Candidatus Babeliales bacterium]